MDKRNIAMDKSFSREHGHGTLSYRNALYQTMHNVLRDNAHTFIIGQGVDDHKGTFGSTLGLAEKFGSDRVIDTPIAEEGIAGIAIGSALNGLYPIQIYIRFDFVLLAMNQLLNLAAKYKYMFGGRFELPMLIRMVIGRGWGQGAQHSQSLQSLFAHIPGLTVIMPSSSQSIIDSYPYIINNYRAPVIAIEHRLLYDLNFRLVNNERENTTSKPWNTFTIRKGKDITIVATSIMVLEALRAANHLAVNSSMDCEIIDLSCVSHPDVNLIIQSVAKTGKLLIADTSWPAYGVCAEVCRKICEYDPSLLKAPVITVGMQPSSCPTAKYLENLFYPNLKILTNHIATLVTGDNNHGIPLPNEQSFTEVYKHFKGPF